MEIICHGHLACVRVHSGYPCMCSQQQNPTNAMTSMSSFCFRHETFKTSSSEASGYCIQVFKLLFLSTSSREIAPLKPVLALHDKHLESVSAALASCFALAGWKGRRARVLFMTVLLGKTHWKKCLSLCGLEAADPINTLSRDIKVTPISHGDHDFAQ